MASSREEDALALAVETTRLLLAEEKPCACGRDTNGTTYANVQDFWSAQFTRRVSSEAKLCWYSAAAQFWQDPANCASSEDGVLGGFGCISPVDIRESARFLRELRAVRPSLQRTAALDCAAGIGRVAKHLLLPQFDRVDLLEQSERLLAASEAYINVEDADASGDLCATSRGVLGQLIQCGMQAFDSLHDASASPLAWDVVWVQWAIGHLTDIDMVDFLQRCRAALRPGGVICLKENVVGPADDIAFEMDTEDSSVTRSLEYYRCIFRQSGLSIVLESQQDQSDWPAELLPVYMWALS